MVADVEVGDQMLVSSGDTLDERSRSVHLHPAERRIVDHLLAIPPYELGTMTSSDLSERSGASRSTIDRLSRKLGFAGLKEMRKSLLLEVGRQERRPDTEARAKSAETDIARRILNAVATRAEIFADLLASNTDLDAALSLLRSARSIQLFGVGESAAACNAIYMRLVRLGIPIVFHEEYHTQVTLASLMQPTDLAIAVSHSGRTKATYHCARAAREQGAKVMLIGGKHDTPLASLADVVVPLPTGPYPGSSEVIDRILIAGLAEIFYQCLAAGDDVMLANSIRIDDAFDEDRL